MSTNFRVIPAVLFSDLFDGALEVFEVREHVTESTNPDLRCLTDGGNYLWAYRGNDGLVAVFTCWGVNAPGKILRAICDAFDVEVVSEYEPQYFGFETQEAMDAAMEKISAEYRDSFYEQVIHYVRGDVHDLKPGTIGMTQAGIAKGLIAEDSDLALPGNRDRLLQAIDATYDRDRAVKITLTPEEVAVARMHATHEDDLPKA
jgi:hypothetical protein